MSAVGKRIISMQNGKITIKQTQDSVVGGYIMTSHEAQYDKVFASRILKNTTLNFRLQSGSDNLTGKQILSACIPQLNYRG